MIELTTPEEFEAAGEFLVFMILYGREVVK